MMHAEAMQPEETTKGVTSIRYETKLCVPPEVLPDVLRIVAAHLPHVRGGPASSPMATLYFDDEQGTNRRLALDGPVSFRLRLREYPGAAGPEHWLEVKRNAGITSDKRRGLLHAAEVAHVLSDPAEAVRRFRLLAPELASAPLRPVLAVRAVRETWAEPGCRVTVDRGVAFFRPPDALGLPIAARLANAVLVEPDATLEIKRSAPARDWMAELRKHLTVQPDSKFVRGARVLGL